jgi:hypothetical protein
MAQQIRTATDTGSSGDPVFFLFDLLHLDGMDTRAAPHRPQGQARRAAQGCRSRARLSRAPLEATLQLRLALSKVNAPS